MKFEVDFNRENDDKTLIALGAVEEPTGADKYPPFECYRIELNNFDDLDNLLKKVDSIKKGTYSAIISFDPPTIYFDKDV